MEFQNLTLNGVSGLKSVRYLIKNSPWMESRIRQKYTDLPLHIRFSWYLAK